MLEQLFAFAVTRGVQSVIVAGSFVTNKPDPGDLDCIMIFPNEQSIPAQIDEQLVLEGCTLDVMCVSETNAELIHSLLNMFSLNAFELPVGMVEVRLDPEKDRSTWDDYENYYSVESLMEARQAYIHRNVVRGVRKKKVLVTVCNLDDYFYWNYELAPIVSSSGWIFAPFIYKSDKASDFVDHFLSWLREIYYTYETEPCVFADGIGTYLLARCMSDPRSMGISMDKIVLSKSVLNADYDWAAHIDRSRAKLVINLLDVTAAASIREKPDKNVQRDAIYGESYRNGFHAKHRKLIDKIYRYPSKGVMDAMTFKTDILPMFHISDTIIENVRKETQNHPEEFVEIFKKKMQTGDLYKL